MKNKLLAALLAGGDDIDKALADNAPSGVKYPDGFGDTEGIGSVPIFYVN